MLCLDGLHVGLRGAIVVCSSVPELQVVLRRAIVVCSFVPELQVGVRRASIVVCCAWMGYMRV